MAEFSLFWSSFLHGAPVSITLVADPASDSAKLPLAARRDFPPALRKRPRLPGRSD
jgi:hypothetical protein